MTIVLSVLLVVCLVTVACNVRLVLARKRDADDIRHYSNLACGWEENTIDVSRQLADAKKVIAERDEQLEKLRVALRDDRIESAKRYGELVRKRDAIQEDLSAKIGLLSAVQQREKALLRRMALIRGQATVVCSKCMLDVCNCDAPKIPDSRPTVDDKIGHGGEFGELAKSVLKESGIPENAPTPAFPPVLRVGDPMERFGDY